MKRFLFIRAIMVLVMVGASWVIIANTVYAASLPVRNAPLEEKYKGEKELEIEKNVGTESDAAEVMKRIKPGQQLPSMILKGLNGKSYDVGAPRNKAMIISFWASWCDPCRLEAPMMNELYSKYKHAVDVYGINVTRYDRLEDVQKFSRSLALRFPILLDEQGAFFEQFGGAAFPTHVMIDHHGQVREIIIGMLSERELEGKIEALQKIK
ncbi:TlpA family protein disulfide reductase [Paenibacillus polymyxa]|uniref:TlpA family protein disulfide reductase n=2 Tax=Paenibacillus polymyxa TaxID=1406 RepID=UPI000382CCC4|nr:TlpA disulfide reductase family protein [Paenibacillus polymyxa]MBE3648003.1 TlpA family protein disulfide reductase [Paenibacillus polymyxa]MDU8675459.1 TlpA disulfide reductase family protein [Paenibacillus polymyxa]MDU8700366.1 TlpA disulfide reductase family protein [Paenibacillus polymyxa]MEE4579012.1 TlpA disulfide reductase family protein [Paenibacillus polymyxa]NMP09864.1 TlpA family protein disulfide reductase [Paenibacillus polymyxa]